MTSLQQKIIVAGCILGVSYFIVRCDHRVLGGVVIISFFACLGVGLKSGVAICSRTARYRSEWLRYIVLYLRKQFRRNRRGPSAEGDLECEKKLFVSSVVKDFIQSWYSYISDDKEFIYESEVVLFRVADDLTRRISNLDTIKTVGKLIVLYTKHLKELAETGLVLKQKNRNGTRVVETDELVNAFQNFDGVEVAFDSETDRLMALTEAVFECVCPSEMYDCTAGRELVVEVVARKVLIPLITMTSEPKWISRTLVRLLSTDDDDGSIGDYDDNNDNLALSDDDGNIRVDGESTRDEDEGRSLRVAPDIRTEEPRTEDDADVDVNAPVEFPTFLFSSSVDGGGDRDFTRLISSSERDDISERSLEDSADDRFIKKIDCHFPVSEEEEEEEEEEELCDLDSESIDRLQMQQIYVTENFSKYFPVDASDDLVGGGCSVAMDKQMTDDRSESSDEKTAEKIYFGSRGENRGDTVASRNDHATTDLRDLPSVVNVDNNRTQGLTSLSKHVENNSLSSSSRDISSFGGSLSISNSDDDLRAPSLHFPIERSRSEFHADHDNGIATAASLRSLTTLSVPYAASTRADRSAPASTPMAENVTASVGAGDRRSVSFYGTSITSTEEVKQMSSGNKFTVFSIEVLSWHHNDDLAWHLKKTTVKRRYSEFVILQEILMENASYAKALRDISGPDKWKTVPFGNMKKSVVTKRKQFLESYLKALLSKPDLNNSAALKDFLAFERSGSLAFVKRANEFNRIDQVFVRTVSGVFNRISSLIPVSEDVVTKSKLGSVQTLKADDDIDVIGWKDDDDLNVVFAVSENTKMEEAMNSDVVALSTMMSSHRDNDIFQELSGSFTKQQRLDGDGSESDNTLLSEDVMMTSVDKVELSDAVIDLVFQCLSQTESPVKSYWIVHVIKIISPDLINTWLEKEIEEITSRARCTEYLKRLREVVWPPARNTARRNSNNEVSREEEDAKNIHLKASQMLHQFLPWIFPWLLGSEAFSFGINCIMDSFQNCKINRHFMFSLFHLIVCELFPEISSGNRLHRRH